MKLSNFQQITKESFPQKYQDLVTVLGDPFNSFAQQVVDGLNTAQITVTDNLNEMYKTINITVDATGKPLQMTTYKSTLSTKTVGLIVVKATNLTSSTTYPTGTPFITWVDNSGTVTIVNITNLQANNQYALVLRAMG